MKLLWEQNAVKLFRLHYIEKKIYYINVIYYIQLINVILYTIINYNTFTFSHFITYMIPKKLNRKLLFAILLKYLTVYVIMFMHIYISKSLYYDIIQALI